jgi:hypothetical protein
MPPQLNCLKMFLFWSVPADNSLATKRLEIRKHKKDVLHLELPATCPFFIAASASRVPIHEARQSRFRGSLRANSAITQLEGGSLGLRLTSHEDQLRGFILPIPSLLNVQRHRLAVGPESTPPFGA